MDHHSGQVGHAEDTFVVRHLTGQEYVVMVTAHSEAGLTQGEYSFRDIACIPNAGSVDTLFPSNGGLIFGWSVDILSGVLRDNLIPLNYTFRGWFRRNHCQ
ncbi:hypothetical protein TNCV_3261391 [Trichonephila clavipes]|nr:hypothetical protein TNCV_3261391 [Trichonephila clavipes]